MLNIEPLNTSIAFALGKNESLTDKWTTRSYKKTKLASIDTEHIKPSMFYYGTVDGYYELFSEHGVHYSAFTKDDYVDRMERHDCFTLVTIGKRLQFGCFHSGVSDKYLVSLAHDLARERDSQRQKMYNWQHTFEFFYPHMLEPLSNKKTKQLVLNVLDDYNVDLSRIDFRDDWNVRNKKALATHYTISESRLDPGNFCMMIYRFNNTNLGTVLHEIGHSLVNTEYCTWKGPVAGHGPEYCLILAELFHRYAGIEFKHTYGSMTNSGGLKVSKKSDFYDGTTYKYHKRNRPGVS